MRNWDFYWCGKDYGYCFRQSNDDDDEETGPKLTCFVHMFEKHRSLTLTHFKQYKEELKEFTACKDLAQLEDDCDFTWAASERQRVLSLVGDTIFEDLQRNILESGELMIRNVPQQQQHHQPISNRAGG